MKKLWLLLLLLLEEVPKSLGGLGVWMCHSCLLSTVCVLEDWELFSFLKGLLFSWQEGGEVVTDFQS